MHDVQGFLDGYVKSVSNPYMPGYLSKAAATEVAGKPGQGIEFGPGMSDKDKADALGSDKGDKGTQSDAQAPMPFGAEMATRAAGGIGGAILGAGISNIGGRLTGKQSRIRDILMAATGGLGGTYAADKAVDHINKQAAGPITENLVGLPANLAAGALLPGANLVGHAATLGGALGGHTSEKEVKDLNKGYGASAAPFVAHHRGGQRLRATYDRSQRDNKENSRALRNILTESFGPLTSSLAAGGIGAGVGAALGEDPAEFGAIAGGGAFVGGQLAAMAMALAKKRRTAKQQSKEDSEGHSLRNLLVPGAGAYESFKRYGSTGKPDPQKFSDY
jgi:hypothetical protein